MSVCYASFTHFISSTNQCLQRDGYRCVLSLALDRKSLETGKATRTLEVEDVVDTVPAHIIPFSIDKDRNAEAVCFICSHSSGF
jgi:hypothetical protein